MAEAYDLGVAEETCSTPFGTLALRRSTPDRTGTLRAWDGADLLLLDHVAELDPTPGSRLLVIGDRFGALSVALHRFALSVVCDSIAVQHAIERNLAAAGATGRVRFVDSLTPRASAAEPSCLTAGEFDVVVWNVERATDLVTATAGRLSALTHAHSVLLAAGLDKHLPPSTASVLRRIGDVTSHPGRRKAHLFTVRPTPGQSSLGRVDAPAFKRFEVPEHRLVLTTAPGGFSADRLDVGARLLAEHIARSANEFFDAPSPADIVDLGCGNGVLGIVALQNFPDARVHFLDHSAAAVAHARDNVRVNVGEEGLRRSSFIRSDVFADAPGLRGDLILCNPPFHHGNATDDEVAWQMLVGAKSRLRRSGSLWMVGNRHLGYHSKLLRLFGNVRQLGAHPKFVLLAAAQAVEDAPRSNPVR